jgi:hypothetical protein
MLAMIGVRAPMSMSNTRDRAVAKKEMLDRQRARKKPVRDPAAGID